MAEYKLKINDDWREEGQTAHAKLELDRKPDHDIKVYYRTEDGSAKDDKDYEGKEGYVIIKPDNWKNTTIDIKTIEDHYKEDNEYFKIKIWTNDGDGNPTPTFTASRSGGDDYGKTKVIVTDDEAKVTITDDDGKDYGKATVCVDDAHAYEGDKLGFKISVEGYGHDKVKVKYYTEKGYGKDGANNDDADYQPTSGEVWVKPGGHEYVWVKTFEDYKVEGDEKMKLWIQDTNDYKRENEYAHGTIKNDDYGKPPGGDPTPTATATLADMSPIA